MVKTQSHEMEGERFGRVLREQVKPATGCTEPVAIALACAQVSHLLQADPDRLLVVASKGIFKNASAAGLPGTPETGIGMAALLGYATARPESGMRVLETASSPERERAARLREAGILTLSLSDRDYDVYVRVEATAGGETATAVIEGSHDRFTGITRNGQPVSGAADGGDRAIPEELPGMRGASVAGIVAFATQADRQALAWLGDGVAMNERISRHGWEHRCGLGLGRGLQDLVDRGVVCDDLAVRIRIAVAAAADARMSGVSLPVMTSCGSGNQGILVSLPLSVYCREKGLGEDRLYRALAVANLVNALAKSYLGKLSPLCGCSVSAGLGAAAGLTWLAGGSLPQIEGAIQGMIANLTGTLCDGAKGTCALKLETAAGEAFTIAMLAAGDLYLRDPQGIVESVCEDSIANLERIGQEGMREMDRTVLELLEKRA